MRAREIQQKIVQYLFDREEKTDLDVILSSDELAEALSLNRRLVVDNLRLLESEGHVELTDSSSQGHTEYHAELTALGRTLVREPDYGATSLETMIVEALPSELRSTAPAIVEPLSQLVDALQALQAVPQQFDSNSQVTEALQALAGRRFDVGSTGITITDSDSASVTVSGQVAGRDIVHITLNTLPGSAGLSVAGALGEAFADITERQRTALIRLIEASLSQDHHTEFAVRAFQGRLDATVTLYSTDGKQSLPVDGWTRADLDIVAEEGYIRLPHTKTLGSIKQKAFREYKLWLAQQRST